MNAALRHHRPRPLPQGRRHGAWPLWAAAITGIMLVFVAALVAFVVWSLRLPSDLVSEDYYARTLRHQEQIDSAARTLAGQPPAVDFLRERQVVRLTFGSPVESGEAEFYRPSDAALDFRVPLAPDAATGLQEIPAEALRHGLWRVRIRWTRGGESHFHEAALTLE